MAIWVATAEGVGIYQDNQFRFSLPRVVQEAHPYASAVLYLTALFFVIALVWAALARLEEVAVGTGRVIPSSQVQVIQNLEGGILAELSVAEGQVVGKDQVLLRIDDTRFTSSFREAQVKRLSLLAAIARLTAEAQGTRLSFPAEVVRGAPNSVGGETASYASRRRALEETVAGLKRSLDLAGRELAMSEPLVAKGAISEVEILRLRRQVNELQTNIDDRRAAYIEVQQILNQDLPYIHLWYTDNVAVHSQRISNLNLFPNGNYDFLTEVHAAQSPP